MGEEHFFFFFIEALVSAEGTGTEAHRAHVAPDCAIWRAAWSWEAQVMDALHLLNAAKTALSQ